MKNHLIKHVLTCFSVLMVLLLCFIIRRENQLFRDPHPPHLFTVRTGLLDAWPDFIVPDQLPNSVLAGEHWEKMTNGITNMFQLAMIAKVWNATIPIPFTDKSYLYGLPAPGRRNLDTIYDIDKLLHLAEQFNIAVFTTFEQFINSSSRKVIGIEMIYNTGKQHILHANMSPHIYNVDCHKDVKFSRDLLNELNSEASKRSLEPFYFVKCCHILPGHDTSPQEINKLYGIHDQGRVYVTILIKHWRGIDALGTYRLHMKQFSKVPHPDQDVPLPHSTNVIQSSNELLLSKLPNLQTKFIGVHLRSERIMQKNRKRTHSFYDKCFQLFYNLNMNLHMRSSLSVLYFGDWTTKTVFGKNMLKHKLELTEYKKSRDNGYNAQVEQAALARAEILILVGGGSFEQQVLNRYRTYNNTGMAYRVCALEATDDKYFTASLIPPNATVERI